MYIPLLYAIIQGICREGVRRGCLRAKSLSAAKITARAFIPWSVAISSASVLLFAWRVPENADGLPQRGYTIAMQLVWLALLLDAFIEPLYITGVYKGETRFEMQVEVAARTVEAFVVWLTMTTAQVAPLVCALCEPHCRVFLNASFLWYLCRHEPSSNASHGLIPSACLSSYTTVLLCLLLLALSRIALLLECAIFTRH